MSRQTLQNVLDGKVWPDLITIHRLEVALGQRLWVNADLGRSVEPLSTREFHQRDLGFFLIGFVDTDRWRAEASPISRSDDAWRWSVYELLTEEGWTRDAEGTAADAHAAGEAAHQHIAERTAADTPPDEHAER